MTRDLPLSADLLLYYGENFRVASESMPMVTTNLGIANLSFGAYVASCDEDGIKRGMF